MEWVARMRCGVDVILCLPRTCGCLLHHAHLPPDARGHLYPVPPMMQIVMAYAGVYETRRALPVFVFDLSRREEALLLDGVLNVSISTSLIPKP